ncbi:MAG: AAA family ATPase, partial [Planctomycetaceae bacterium]|nr:AAA family ATPase [Planctomycetaceae bacterium]
HRRRDLGWRFLNAYLERTGDYAGLPVLPFYLVYRALVRAKVAALRLQQAGLDPTERERLNTECRGYLDLALHDAAPRRCSLTITHGLSGSGKTTGSQLWIESQGGIRLRSDVERKRLFHIAPDQAAPEESYSSAASTQTYSQLAVLARRVIRAGFPVVVDATFLKFDERHRFRQLAHELGVPFQILAFEAHDDILRARIQSRLAAGRDASDATLAVLAAQRQAVEPLTADERADVISPATPDTEQTATPGS